MIFFSPELISPWQPPTHAKWFCTFWTDLWCTKPRHWCETCWHCDHFAPALLPSPKHVCSAYSKAKLGAAAPTTYSSVLFPITGNGSLNWSLDINIYNLYIETNITHTLIKRCLCICSPWTHRFGMFVLWLHTGQQQQAGYNQLGQEFMFEQKNTHRSSRFKK